MALQGQPPDAVAVSAFVRRPPVSDIGRHDLRAPTKDQPVHHHEDLHLGEARETLGDAHLRAAQTHIFDLAVHGRARPEILGIQEAALHPDVEGHPRMLASGLRPSPSLRADGEAAALLHVGDLGRGRHVDHAPADQRLLHVGECPDEARQQAGRNGDGFRGAHRFRAGGGGTPVHPQLHLRVTLLGPERDPHLLRLVAQQSLESLSHGQISSTSGTGRRGPRRPRPVRVPSPRRSRTNTPQ